jgi:osmotically-inducible protein OsmY
LLANPLSCEHFRRVVPHVHENAYADTVRSRRSAMKAGTTDKTIEDAVMQELDWDPEVTATHFGVSAKDGAIVLTGRVSSYGQRVAAVRAAERIYGVRAVADEIEVELPGASVCQDAEIVETVLRQLRANTRVPDTVKVEVRDGLVTLRGTVEWSYQRDAAERPIELVRGVHAVTNLIKIKPRAKPRAADIERRVHAAIGRMADLDARSIGVTVRNGAVHLEGHVHSVAERRIAERAAAAAPGVRKVNNEITVTP